MLSIFLCACWTSEFPLWKKISIQFFCPFLIEMLFFFFQVELYELFIYVGYMTPYQSYHLQISSLICQVIFFCFVDGFLCYAKAFKFNCVPCVYFCFCFHYSRMQIQKKILLQFISKSVLLMFSSRSFIVSGLIFRSLIYSIFLYMVLENVLTSFFYM